MPPVSRRTGPEEADNGVDAVVFLSLDSAEGVDELVAEVLRWEPR